MFNPLQSYKLFASILKSNVSPRETAVGVLLAMFLGFTPLNGPFALVFFAVFIIFRMSSVSTLFALPVFKLLYVAGLSRVADSIGSYLLLDAGYLKEFWRWLVNLPVIAFLDINNTIVCGGIAMSLALCVPVYFISKKVNVVFRKTYGEKTKNIKMFQWLASANLAPAAPAPKPASRVKALLSRLNTRKLVMWISILVVFHLGFGFLSPLFSSFLIDKISAYSPAKLTIEKAAIWPLTLSFSLKNLKIFDPQKTDERLIAVRDASFRLSPLALLSKRFVIADAGVNAAEVDLQGTPDGSFNLQKLTQAQQPEKKTGLAQALDIFKKKKDLFGRAYDLLKKRSSKKAVEERKAQQQEANKTVVKAVDLPRGRKVEFQKPRDLYVFEIRAMDMSNVTIHLKSENGQAVDLDRARVRLKGFAFDPQAGSRINALHLAGGIKKEGKSAGRLEFIYAKGLQKQSLKTEMDFDLRGVDVDAVRFIYEDSLPVALEKGTLDLRSNTTIIDDLLDSKTNLTLKGQKFAAKGGGELLSGFVSMPSLTDALNAIDPLKMGFTITGTVENPDFKGFQESLTALVKPYLKNVQDKAKNQASGFLENLIKKK